MTTIEEDVQDQLIDLVKKINSGEWNNQEVYDYYTDKIIGDVRLEWTRTLQNRVSELFSDTKTILHDYIATTMGG